MAATYKDRPRKERPKQPLLLGEVERRLNACAERTKLRASQLRCCVHQTRFATIESERQASATTARRRFGDSCQLRTGLPPHLVVTSVRLAPAKLISTVAEQCCSGGQPASWPRQRRRQRNCCGLRGDDRSAEDGSRRGPDRAMQARSSVADTCPSCVAGGDGGREIPSG
jgi:hypothetical protein